MFIERCIGGGSGSLAARVSVWQGEIRNNLGFLTVGRPSTNVGDESGCRRARRRLGAALSPTLTSSRGRAAKERHFTVALARTVLILGRCPVEVEVVRI